MTDCHYKIRFDLLDAKQVAPEDIFDAIKTLSFEKKFIIDVNAPGMGPNALLSWALEELSEAENSTHRPAKLSPPPSFPRLRPSASSIGTSTARTLDRPTFAPRREPKKS
ncbi:MAG: hypothetical protein IPO88_20340 [Nannocystis sp.]|uniref:hypothetical protein n=1 Tax=Nannocystis sp. TaxID=1962667 RepID=UPI0024229B4A|nr:hypothetical protein [Nannocystis sp.]MBK9755809.1 hypothetical protein [Nannocystis sp.]